MANKALFKSGTPGVTPPPTDTVNEAGGTAYTLEPKLGLAQLVSTGCLNDVFYCTAEQQLEQMLALARKCPAEYVGKAAVYARQRGFMKDAPALLCAYLSTFPEGREVLKKIFRQVIDNGRMARNFVQILRSGAVGRKSLGTMPKRLVQEYLLSRDPEDLFRDNVGNSPSMVDLIKLTRPKTLAADQEATFRYLLQNPKKPHNPEALPLVIREYEAFKANPKGTPPAVDFRYLDSLGMDAEQWSTIALRGGWQFVRMNLNTFARHGVFKDPKVTADIAAKLRDPESVRKARVFPYQLLVAYNNVGDGVPHEVKEAIQDAMEVATENVPEIPGRLYLCPDVSGSMGSPVTGERKGSTTKVSCVQCAALITAALMRRNKAAGVIPFDDRVRTVNLNPRDTVMTNAQKLSINGGGTACSAPVIQLNQHRTPADLVVIISDNQSWADFNPQLARGAGWGHSGTALASAWAEFKARNPKAKLALIDLQPYTTAQMTPSKDVLFVGGFSDAVFDLLSAFAREGGGEKWVSEIDSIALG